MTNQQLSARGVRGKGDGYSHLWQQSSMVRVSIQQTVERASQRLEIAEIPQKASPEVSFYMRS